MLSIALLSRIQFAFTMSFHILFPSFSIGLALFLTVIEGLWLKTRNPMYYQICKFWIKVFALTFGMGVVSGIVMEFQLGTNWAGFSAKVGSVLGPLFVYEVMTAFFIEAGALGIMIFGWKKVGDKLHYLATILVMLGTTLSAYWIMSANSWMQHPIGYAIENGKFIVTSWLDVVFNPITLPRFLHMIFASYVSALFVILGVSSYYLSKKIHVEFAKINFKFAAYALIVMMPLQIFIGDLSGVNVHKYQPLKTAAMEGLWDTQKSVPLVLFAIPDQNLQKNLYEFNIPYGASLLNTHTLDGELIGLKSVSPSDQPLVLPVFFSFRIMTGIGFLMLFLSVIALYLAYKDKLINYEGVTSRILKIFTFASPIGFIAILSGWFVAEFGRQPWAVYNLIRTQDAVSQVSPYDALVLLILIVLVYGVVFGWFYFYFLIRTIKHGPQHESKNLEPFEYMRPQLEEEKS
jgi:cytochrome d ubiquinol oxidase subunit I